MKRLWYTGQGAPLMPEGMPRPADWQQGIAFDDDVAARILAKHGPGGSGQWSDTDPQSRAARKGDINRPVPGGHDPKVFDAVMGERLGLAAGGKE